MIRVLTESDERFIGDNYLRMSWKKMAEVLGVPKGTVGSCCGRNGWRVSDELKAEKKAAAQRLRSEQKHAAPQPGDEVIRAKYLELNGKALAREINRSNCYLQRRMKELGLVVPAAVIEERIMKSRWQEGAISYNKGKKQSEFLSLEGIERTKATRFQAGHLPHNTAEGDGAISVRVDTKTGIEYKYIRVALGKWELLQRVVWEQHNGPIPKGCMVRFKDKDSMNCAPENLELITLAENMRRNSWSVNLSDEYVAHLLAGKYFKHLREELAQRPDLIEVKRLQIQLKRTIKNRLNEREQSNNGHAEHDVRTNEAAE